MPPSGSVSSPGLFNGGPSPSTLSALVSQHRLLELSRFGLRGYDLAQHMLTQQGAVSKLLGEYKIFTRNSSTIGDKYGIRCHLVFDQRRLPLVAVTEVLITFIFIVSMRFVLLVATNSDTSADNTSTNHYWNTNATANIITYILRTHFGLIGRFYYFKQKQLQLPFCNV